METLKESFILNGLDFLRLRYIGDNAILITGEGEENIQNIIDEQREWFLSIFESITTWNNHIVLGNRMCWVRCWGLP